jgi:hypothetical protein
MDMNRAMLIDVTAWMIGAILVLAPAALADDPEATTQPDEAVETPTTQPEVAPAVIQVGPAREAPVTPAIKPRDEGDAEAEPKPAAVEAPSAREVMDMLQEGDADGPANAPTRRDVERELEPDDEGGRAVLPVPAGKQSPLMHTRTAHPDATRRLLPEGTVIVDRTGILKADQGRWVFVFEADSSALDDPPLILLPNSYLESMQKQANYGKRDVKFRISGVVTQYQGANYLFLRKVLIVRNLDRF